MFKQFAYALAATLSVITLSACSGLYDSLPPCPVDEEDTAYVNLRISVAANNSFVPGGTRAEEVEYDKTPFFEPGIPPYEDINSLRVIMVNEEDKIEYNEFVEGPKGESTANYQTLQMRTRPGGTRMLYLIANEDVVYNLMPKGSKVNFKLINPGDYFPETTLGRVIINTDASGSPIINNTGEEKNYVPMTEIFEVPIYDWGEDEPIDQSVSLFVTRAAVKFSFMIKTNLKVQGEGDTSSEVAGSNFVLGRDYMITNIAINSTANSEFLFPNGTTYNPPKNLNSNLDREITNYDVPNSELAPANIAIPAEAYDEEKNYKVISATDSKYGIFSEGDKVFKYSPLEYFPETKLTDGNYSIDVTVKWLNEPDDEEVQGDTNVDEATGETDESDTSDPHETVISVPLDNLPYGLPRNTHVMIIISPGTHTLEATAVLVPYIGVDLEPDFGFNTLVPSEIPSDNENDNEEENEDNNNEENSN